VSSGFEVRGCSTTFEANVNWRLRESLGSCWRAGLTAVEITERSAARISDLEEAGYLTRTRNGRRNRYEVHDERPLRQPKSIATIRSEASSVPRGPGEPETSKRYFEITSGRRAPSRQEGEPHAFTYKLVLEDGTPADPPKFVMAMPTWHKGATVVIRPGFEFEIVSMHERAEDHGIWTVRRG
jgi:hypothetical protein